MSNKAGSEEGEDARLLEETYGFIAEQRFYLRKAIQTDDLEHTLQRCIASVGELRSSKLLPENYYKVYSLVSWELHAVAAFLQQTKRHGKSLTSLYDLVQHEGNVLTRLYMMITVVSVLLPSCDAVEGENLLEDMCSMLSAVQHPIRGLFIRYYMLQVTKDKVARVCGGHSAICVLLANFREAANLWVRLRGVGESAACGSRQVSSGAVAETTGESKKEADFLAAAEVQGLTKQPQQQPVRDRISKTQQSLQLLVSAHLVQIARLPVLTAEMHAELILPEVLRLATGDDPAGQAHLLQCFVDSFPDEYHAFTVERILGACLQLHWVVDLRVLLRTLLQGLTSHLHKVDGSVGGASKPDVFVDFERYLREVRRRQQRDLAAPLSSLLELQLELLFMTIILHPSDASRIDQVLSGVAELLTERRQTMSKEQNKDMEPAVVQTVIDILAASLTSADAVAEVVAMPHHQSIVSNLSHADWRRASHEMANALLEADVKLSDVSTLRRVLELLDPMLHDDQRLKCLWRPLSLEDADNDGPWDIQLDKVDQSQPAFKAEQTKVSQLVHQLRHEDPSQGFEMLKVMRDFFIDGGPHRVVHTLPACIVAALRLGEPLASARRKSGAAEAVRAVNELLLFCHSLLEDVLAKSPIACQERRQLWLLCGSCAAKICRVCSGAIGEKRVLVESCRHAMEKAIACLEEEVFKQSGDCRSSLLGVELLVGTLPRLHALLAEHYQALAGRLITLSEALPTSTLQSSGLGLCIQLFCGADYLDAKQALRCLQTALRIADCASHENPRDVGLFVELTDQALYLFEHAGAEVTPEFVSHVLALCAQHLRYAGTRTPADVRRAFRSTLADLEARADDARYRAIDLAPCRMDELAF
eukprot:TRINITY_DN54892_c0_g1_i1.p1 TRINITY_DN54892_c0_g1~~TRINITY_DN54892_c0_g1_i1.p1  ORF type:complete len:875 (-),score=205.46 TRINITY_DN54892_c0_g1_i1:56-2680(-)